MYSFDGEKIVIVDRQNLVATNERTSIDRQKSITRSEITVAEKHKSLTGSERLIADWCESAACERITINNSRKLTGNSKRIKKTTTG